MTTYPDELVEAVARALCREEDGNPDDGMLELQGRPRWEGWVKPATAALDAIAAQGLVVVPAEPTREMIENRQRFCVYMSDEDKAHDAENLRDAWTDMAQRARTLAIEIGDWTPIAARLRALYTGAG